MFSRTSSNLVRLSCESVLRPSVTLVESKIISGQEQSAFNLKNGCSRRALFFFYTSCVCVMLCVCVCVCVEGGREGERVMVRVTKKNGKSHSITIKSDAPGMSAIIRFHFILMSSLSD